MYIYTVDIQGSKLIEIRNTIYFYSASPESIKIFIKPSLDSDLKQKFEFKGNYIDKKCCFRIDQKGRFKFLGEVKPPKDPFKKLFWEKGFTGSRRCKSIEEFHKSVITTKKWFENNFQIPSVETQEKAKEYFKHILSFIRDTTDNSIKKKDYYGDFHLISCCNNPIVLYINTKNKSWWASEDLTLEEAKLILNEMV